MILSLSAAPRLAAKSPTSLLKRIEFTVDGTSPNSLQKFLYLLCVWGEEVG